MKPLSIAVAGCLGLFTVAVTLLLLVGFGDYRKLGQERVALQAGLQAANERIGNLERDKASLARELDARRGEVRDLGTKLTEATAINSKTNTVGAAPTQPRPYRVPVFLGNDYLGLAWMVPRNPSKDLKTGRTGFEPVVLLDPAWRRTFAESTTEVGDQPQAPSYTAVYNYYNPWPWIFVPGVSGRQTNGLTRMPPSMLPKGPASAPRVNEPRFVIGATRAVMPGAGRRGTDPWGRYGSDLPGFQASQGGQRTAFPRQPGSVP